MNARHRGTACVAGGVAWLVAACGGSERGAPSGGAGERGARVVTGDPASAPGGGRELGGGQTSDFGDGIESPCLYVTETLSREVALAEGWPVDADLALLQPLVVVEARREGASSGPAATLRIASQLVGIRVARGTPLPELAGRVECEPMLRYAVDVSVVADAGWIEGLFHAELSSSGGELYGSAFEPAESVGGTLALNVDRGRPHRARANLALGFTRESVHGELALVVYYSDQREPLMGMGERLFWPSSDAATGRGGAQPLEAGSEWLSLDDYRAGEL